MLRHESPIVSQENGPASYREVLLRNAVLAKYKSTTVRRNEITDELTSMPIGDVLMVQSGKTNPTIHGLMATAREVSIVDGIKGPLYQFLWSLKGDQLSIPPYSIYHVPSIRYRVGVDANVLRLEPVKFDGYKNPGLEYMQFDEISHLSPDNIQGLEEARKRYNLLLRNQLLSESALAGLSFIGLISGAIFGFDKMIESPVSPCVYMLAASGLIWNSFNTRSQAEREREQVGRCLNGVSRLLPEYFTTS